MYPTIHRTTMKAGVARASQISMIPGENTTSTRKNQTKAQVWKRAVVQNTPNKSIFLTSVTDIIEKAEVTRRLKEAEPIMA